MALDIRRLNRTLQADATPSPSVFDWVVTWSKAAAATVVVGMVMSGSVLAKETLAPTDGLRCGPWRQWKSDAAVQQALEPWRRASAAYTFLTHRLRAATPADHGASLATTLHSDAAA